MMEYLAEGTLANIMGIVIPLWEIMMMLSPVSWIVLAIVIVLVVVKKIRRKLLSEKA